MITIFYDHYIGSLFLEFNAMLMGLNGMLVKVEAF